MNWIIGIFAENTFSKCWYASRVMLVGYVCHMTVWATWTVSKEMKHGRWVFNSFSLHKRKWNAKPNTTFDLKYSLIALSLFPTHSQHSCNWFSNRVTKMHCFVRFLCEISIELTPSVCNFFGKKWVMTDQSKMRKTWMFKQFLAIFQS